MNKRAREILSRLMSANGYQQNFSLQQLAELHGVSTRTIRYDLNKINEFLDENAIAKIDLSPGGILRVPANLGRCAEALPKSVFYSLQLSRNEKATFILTILSSANKFVTLSELADDLMVSRSTLIQDMENAKKMAPEYHLILNSYPNHGVLLEGLELDKRRMLLHLIHAQKSVFKPGPLLQHLLSILERKTGVSPEQEMIEKIVNEAEHMHGQFLTDPDFHFLVSYLMFTAIRLKRGHLIDDFVPDSSASETMAYTILMQMDHFSHITINSGEIGFLSKILSKLRYLKKTKPDDGIVKIQIVTRKFIEDVSNKLGIDLKQDYIFYENLSNHLASTFSEVNYDSEVNVVIQEMLERYPRVVDVVQDSLGLLETYTRRKISRAEAGYIMVHVCAAIERKVNTHSCYNVVLVCQGGIGTSQLLQERLKKYFNFQVKDIISAHDFNINTTEADLVISTVPLKKAEGKYVQVSPLLSDTDFIKVGNALSGIRTQLATQPIDRAEKERRERQAVLFRILHYIDMDLPREELKAKVTQELEQALHIKKEPPLSMLLPAQAIRLNVECSDWQEAIRCSAEYLLEQNYILPSYVDAMVENVKQNGPYMVLAPQFALPHEAPTAGVLRTGMSLIRLKTPVKFNHQSNDPIEWVCCLCTVDKASHLKAVFCLVNLIQNAQFRSEIAQAESAEEVAAIIGRYEGGFYERR